MGYSLSNSNAKKKLEADLTFEEVTAAVKGLSSGKAPGIDGLSSEFYKKFWTILGSDFLMCSKNA